MLLLTASGSCFASQLLPLPFFRLLIPGLTASPPGELEHLPNAPKAGWKGGRSSISRTSRNVLPGEPSWLPPSFFIHENSISLGAGCQQQALQREVLWPTESCPGVVPDSGTGEVATLSSVHTPAGVPHQQPELAQAGLVALATHPGARAHQTQTSHPLEVTLSHHCSRSGTVMFRDGIPKQSPVTWARQRPPAPPHTARGTHSPVLQALQRQLQTPPPISQREHKGRKGLLIPSCSAFPAVCATLRIGNNLPFAVSQLTAQRKMMHPELQGEGAQVEPPRKRLHTQQPPKTICRRPPSRILCREGSVAPFSPCSALPALIPVQGPAWGRLCLLLATFLCLGRDKEGATGSACRVPRAPLLPGKFLCHLPSGTLRSARVNAVFPKSITLGLLLSCGPIDSAPKHHLRCLVQKY